MAKPKEQNPLIIVGAASKKAKQAQLPDAITPIMGFDQWWLLTQSRLGLAASVKEALKNHMKSRGFLSTGRYDDGLRDFGYKS